MLKRCNRRILKSEAKKKKEKEKEKEKPSRVGSVKKPCNMFLDKGSCIYGDRCKFLHITMDEYEAMLKEEQKQSEEVIVVEEEVKKEEEVKVEEEEVKKEEEVKVEEEESKKEEENTTKDEEGEEDNYTKDPEEGQLCHMLPLLTHEVVEGYRNKCSFTIGLNQNNEPSVGFRMGSFVEGNVRIGEIE